MNLIAHCGNVTEMVVATRLRRRLLALVVALGTAAIIVIAALVAEAIMRRDVIASTADSRVESLERDSLMIERRISNRINDLAFLKTVAEKELAQSPPPDITSLPTLQKVAETLTREKSHVYDALVFDSNNQVVMTFGRSGSQEGDTSPLIEKADLEKIHNLESTGVLLFLGEVGEKESRTKLMYLGSRILHPDGTHAGILVISCELRSILREMDMAGSSGDFKAFVSRPQDMALTFTSGDWRIQTLQKIRLPIKVFENTVDAQLGRWFLDFGDVFCVRDVTAPGDALGEYAPRLQVANPGAMEWKIVTMVPVAAISSEIRSKQSGVWLVSAVAILMLAPAAFVATLSFLHLSEVRNQLDRVFESSMHGVLAVKTVRGEGNEIRGFEVLRSNPAAEPFLKTDKTALIDALGPWLKDMITRGLPATREYELHHGGVTKYYSVRADKLGDGAVISCADLTQRKKDEEALRASESSLRLAAKMSKVGAWSIQYPEKELTWSAEIRRIHGVPDDFQPTLAKAIAFYPPGSRERISHAVEACEKERQPFDLETEFRNSEGRIMWVRAIGEPEFNPETGTLKRIVGTFQDITETRKASMALAESRERLSTAFWGAGMSLADWKIATNEIAFDKNWAEVLGYRPEEVVPTLEFWDSLIPEEDQPGIEKAQARYFDGEADLFEAEYRMRSKDGTYRWVLERARITEVDSAGKPSRMSGVLVDITSRKLMEQKLEEALEHEQELTRASRAAEFAKRNFLAVMSHEIRTPMNSIIGFAEMLLSEKLPPNEKEHVQTIKESGESLLRIINDILDYSRIESGRLQLEKTTFAPREVIENVVSMLDNMASKKGILLKAVCAPDVPNLLVGDPGRLNQILLNLVGNAVKFTHKGSVSVQVEVAPEHGPVARIRFRIVDTGIGISADKLQSIFEPFTQADATISRSHGGTGLGLAISNLLVNLLGGTLHVSSQPGEGSDFHFDLPFGQRAQTEKVKIAPQARPDVSFGVKYPLNILVAEDDKVNARLTRLMLEKLGYAPTIVQDGRLAVEAACSKPYDLILMDLHMPRMDGIEATTALRQHEREKASDHRTRIVAFTADVLPEERQSCFDAGMDDYLTKPLALSRLCDALREAAEHLHDRGKSA